MSNKKNKPNLKGMEHLYQELDSETSTTEIHKDVNNDKKVISETKLSPKEKSNLKKELVIIIIIMTILFGILALILYLDKSSDFLRTLAEKLTNLY